jgi:hypothetical protein
MIGLAPLARTALTSVFTPAKYLERNNDVSEKLGNSAIAVLVSILFAPFVLAADENNGIRQITDSVYSFTLGEGNHSMFVIGEDGVAVFVCWRADRDA